MGLGRVGRCGGKLAHDADVLVQGAARPRQIALRNLNVAELGQADDDVAAPGRRGRICGGETAGGGQRGLEILARGGQVALIAQHDAEAAKVGLDVLLAQHGRRVGGRCLGVDRQARLVDLAGAGQVALAGEDIALLLQPHGAVTVVGGRIDRLLRRLGGVGEAPRVLVEAAERHPVPALPRIEPGDQLVAADHRGGVELAAVAGLERQLGDAAFFGGAVDVGGLLPSRVASRTQFVEDRERADLIAVVELRQRRGAVRGRGDVGDRASKHRDLDRVRLIARRELGDVVVLRRHQRRALRPASADQGAELVDLGPLGLDGDVGDTLLGRLRRGSGEEGGGDLCMGVDRGGAGWRGGQRARDQHRHRRNPRRPSDHRTLPGVAAPDARCS